MKTRLASVIDVFSEDSVKGLILSALAREWPLTARRLHFKVAMKKAIGYHAVYKTINQMVKEGILRKEEKGYFISIQWLEAMDSTFSRMKECFMPDRPAYLPTLADVIEEGESHTITFENMAEAESYRKKLQVEYLESGMNKPYAGLYYHIRTPLIYTERSAKATGIVFKEHLPVFILVEGETPVDKWCADYYRSSSLKVRLGMKSCVKDCEIMVVGDHIFQFFIPKKTRNYMDSLYSSVKHASEISIPDFYSRVYLEKIPVKIVLTKNSAVAEQIRQNVTSHFETDRIAVFSILGTFVENSLYYDIAEHLYAKNLLNKEPARKLMNLGEKWRKGRINLDAYMRKYFSYYTLAVKGKKQKDIEECIRELISENINRILFKNAARLMSFTYSYTNTLALTRMPLEFVKGFEPYVIFNSIISTELETKDGVYTGRIKRFLCTEREKERTFLEWAKDKNLEGSVGFGNRMPDLGFLRHMDIPIALNADDDLKRHAKKNGWLVHKKESMEELIEHVQNILYTRGDTR